MSACIAFPRSTSCAKPTGEAYKRHGLTRWISKWPIFSTCRLRPRSGRVLTCLTDWAARVCRTRYSSPEDPTSARLWDESSWWWWGPPQTCARIQRRPSSTCERIAQRIQNQIWFMLSKWRWTINKRRVSSLSGFTQPHVIPDVYLSFLNMNEDLVFKKSITFI